MIVVVVVVVVINCGGSTLSGLTLHPAVWIIIVGVDEAKGSVIGVRGLDTAVGTVIVQQYQLFVIITFTFRSFKKELQKTQFLRNSFRQEIKSVSLIKPCWNNLD